MTLEKGLINKEDMKQRQVHLLCPDKDCNLFSDKDNPTYYCERECPRKDELSLVFSCVKCSEPIFVPIDYGSCRPIRGHICSDGINRRQFLPFDIPPKPLIKIYKMLD